MPAHAIDYLTEVQAQKVLFAEADQFVQKQITLSDEMVDKIKDLTGTRQRNKNPLIWEAKKKGKSLGYFFVDQVVGKHEYITYALGIDTNNLINGLEILSYRETRGGEVRNEGWRKQFKGKKITDPFKLDVDVPNITGATLSSRNLLDGAKRLLNLKKLLDDAKAI